MKTLLLLLICSGLVFVNPLFAKPDWAGQGGAAKAEKKEYQKTYQEKKYADDEDEVRQYRHGGQDDERQRNREQEKEKKFKNKEQKQLKDGKGPKGQEKQREKKMEQEQKELGKGSEQGQNSREKRKKWWKFWGGEES
ncbi:hypothetical protein SAMN02745165_01458 [Malonomonas rubra DSM 5091]|uniref:Uncharacterized protein n=1 Tax=Malonomonas rubra DSM 5091 TaxID=1122189 RepID=A0A1M6G983_MALRU|nr:hypothetical protein [Malonomonas rubra]SHJ06501.1 hypothetical protein SAMN02745165_01458 [Malonomonas rubra DSM 5091]